MSFSSLPPATNQRIRASRLPGELSSPSSPYSVGYASSLAESKGISNGPGNLIKQPLAWAGVRHQVEDFEQQGSDSERIIPIAPPCNHIVMLTCLHLSHEMALRDVGMYAWMTPSVKDPSESMLGIMKSYAESVKQLARHAELACSTVPDPSKASIQHHVQKARLAAGLDSYIAVLYSGHGIQEPPTEAGELWCYDRSFEECLADGGSPSEYIPVLLFDLMTWAGASTCYVWDCQHAGRFIKAAVAEAEEIDTQLRAAAIQNPSIAKLHPALYSRRHIHFAACGANQRLPRPAGMPDDIFTSCLVTPLRTALLFHNLNQYPLSSSHGAKYRPKSNEYMDALWHSLPRDLRDRLRSELFAILHTIAWQSLEGEDFQKLFGQSGDVVSALAGGFMLSQRIMATYRVTPESIPTIPPSTAHALWVTWDLILDNLFEQLPVTFDPDVYDPTWTDKLSLVSFMSDQLSSILCAEQGIDNIDNPLLVTSVGLSRLPIIRQAALTPPFRKAASIALDACLKSLDLQGLAHAVQGGALDVAARLLALNDPDITPNVVSIWASLARSEGCISGLLNLPPSEGRLVPAQAVSFFLDHLEQCLTEDNDQVIPTVVQAAAVLSSMANITSLRSTDSDTRILQLSLNMLLRPQELVRQWGALLVAEATYDTPLNETEDRDLISDLTEQLHDMLKSNTVETRAAAVHALASWISTTPIKDISTIENILLFSKQLIPELAKEASPMVRKELAGRFERVLQSGGIWTTLVLWLYLYGAAISQVEEEKVEGHAFIRQISIKLNLQLKQKQLMRILTDVLMAYMRLRHDPDSRVSGFVSAGIRVLTNDLRTYTPKQSWTMILQTAMPVLESTDRPKWSPALVTALKAAGVAFTNDWERRMSVPAKNTTVTRNRELFQKHKLALQAYLVNEDWGGSFSEKYREAPSDEEKTWILRHRVLEDSLVVAQQQVGLPWKWEMKNIISPEPWTFVRCHSFLPLLMSSSKPNELLFWDWSAASSVGKCYLNLSAGSEITYARFVNELHEQTIALTEISNGDIHVLKMPADDPSLFKPISTFRALNISSHPIKGKLVTSWWRQSGKLTVGGPLDIIRIWDCPAERCVQTLKTESSLPVTAVTTEPLSGNIVIAGMADGKVMLYDIRQGRKLPLLSWQGDQATSATPQSGKSILKNGVVLSESSTITSACSNGMINIHDLRHLSQPCTSVMAHANGTSTASFQSHSGLMSTISNLNPPSTASSSTFSLANLSLNQGPSRQRANWALYRSSGSTLTTVTAEEVVFETQTPVVVSDSRKFKPYTILHPLRPFLGIGFGRTCFLRGSGVGNGDDTDSGSYDFLKSQEKYATRDFS